MNNNFEVGAASVGCDIKVKTGKITDNDFDEINVIDSNNEIKTVALVCRDTLKVIFLDSSFKDNSIVNDFIKSHQKKRFESISESWGFVGQYYPGYHQCDEIALANDLEVLIEKEHEEGSCAHDLLLNDYDGDIDNPQIQKDYDAVHGDIYERSINGFLDMVEGNMKDDVDSQ